VQPLACFKPYTVLSVEHYEVVRHFPDSVLNKGARTSYPFLNSEPPKMRTTTKSTRKIKKRILAMEAAPAAIPVNPKTPAMIAMMKKMTAHFNIVVSF
jgi:hypothetical protein